MADVFNLERFVTAQAGSYADALAEIKNGRKRSHWMWFIFPQIAGLGRSDTAQYYAIKSLKETESYLHHPVLGPRLIEISTELLKLQSSNANQIFGSPDDMKLHSSMTLFAEVTGANAVFSAVLQKFFGGEKDKNTLERVR